MSSSSRIGREREDVDAAAAAVNDVVVDDPDDDEDYYCFQDDESEGFYTDYNQKEDSHGKRIPHNDARVSHDDSDSSFSFDSDGEDEYLGHDEEQNSENEFEYGSESDSEPINGRYINEVNVQEAWKHFLGTKDRRLDLYNIVLTASTLEYLLEQGRNLKYLLQQQSQRKPSRQTEHESKECLVERISLVKCTFSVTSSMDSCLAPEWAKWDEFLSLAEPKIFVLGCNHSLTLQKQLQGLYHCHSLEELTICKVNNLSIPWICKTLHTALTAPTCNIQKLHLRCCRMCSNVMLCLEGIVRNHSLGFSEFYLEECNDFTGERRDNMTDMKVVLNALVESNSRNTLCSLSLSYTESLSPSTWSFFTVLLKEFPNLGRLFLSNCNNLFKHVETNNELYLSFSAALGENKTLKLLDLMYCGLTDALAAPLFRALEGNTTLVELNVGGELLTESLMASLPRATGLQTLNVNLDPYNTKSLYPAFWHNTSLIQINYGTADPNLNPILRRNKLLQQTARFLSQGGKICFGSWPFCMEELGSRNCSDPSALYAFLTGTVGHIFPHQPKHPLCNK